MVAGGLVIGGDHRRRLVRHRPPRTCRRRSHEPWRRRSSAPIRAGPSPTALSRRWPICWNFCCSGAISRERSPSASQGCSGWRSGRPPSRLATRTFRWEGFASTEDLVNHIAGGLLMGFGGVCALGMYDWSGPDRHLHPGDRFIPRTWARSSRGPWRRSSTSTGVPPECEMHVTTMIVYDLICAHQHRFEGWFESAAEYARQRARFDDPLPGLRRRRDRAPTDPATFGLRARRSLAKHATRSRSPVAMGKRSSRCGA